MGVPVENFGPERLGTCPAYISVDSHEHPMLRLRLRRHD